MAKYVIGVDVGGTKIATGIVSKKGKLIHKVVLPTFASKGLKISLEQVYKSIEDVVLESDVSMADINGIGVCAPGPLDPAVGIVHNPPNLTGWHEVPLAGLIKKKFRKKTQLENDANAAGIAEFLWGAAKGYKDVLYVTVSTGIGTAIIIDGKIYHGKNGMAAEAGHCTINYTDKTAVCNCGNIGCIETLASGPNTAKRLIARSKGKPGIRKKLAKMAGGKIKDLTMEKIANAAQDGDKLAIKTITDQAELLGIWLGNMVSVLDPEIIVIGGGVSLIGSLLFKNIRKTMPKHTLNVFAHKTPIVQAKLKKDVGIFGAASVVM